jgi:hypothetical protein
VTTAYVGSDLVDSEDFMAPRRVRVSYRCEACGHSWSRVYKATPKSDPPCPNKACAQTREMAELKRQVANLTAMLSEGRAPATIGASIIVKAVDETARIVMEDHNMTNLRDGVRHGESIAPALPPEQQKAADNFFGGADAKAGLNMQGHSIRRKQMEALGRRAIGGAFRASAINPTELVGGKRGERPLRSIGTEKLK